MTKPLPPAEPIPMQTHIAYVIPETGPHIKTIQVTQLICQKCFHKWQKRRKTLPLICSKCKNRRWDRPKCEPKENIVIPE